MHTTQSQMTQTSDKIPQPHTTTQNPPHRSSAYRRLYCLPTPAVTSLPLLHGSLEICPLRQRSRTAFTAPLQMHPAISVQVLPPPPPTTTSPPLWQLFFTSRPSPLPASDHASVAHAASLVVVPLPSAAHSTVPSTIRPFHCDPTGNMQSVPLSYTHNITSTLAGMLMTPAAPGNINVPICCRFRRPARRILNGRRFRFPAILRYRANIPPSLLRLVCTPAVLL
jgi:hypothetical protein